MGKVPIRLREVVYTLSPFEQTVMNGVFKDVPAKLHRKFAEVRPVDFAAFLSSLTELKMFVSVFTELGGRGSILPCTCCCYFCVSSENFCMFLT